MLRSTLGLLAAWFVLACAPADGPVEPPVGKGPAPPDSTPPTSAPPSPARPAAWLYLHKGTDEDTEFVGGRTTLYLDATDSRGQPVSSAGTTYTSSNPSVAIVTRFRVVTASRSDGTRWEEAHADVSFVGPGTAVLRAALDGKESSVVLRVRDVPGPATNAAIERFELIEHRVGQQLVYTPVVLLRNTAVTGSVSAVALELTVPGQSLGLCTGDFPIDQGAVRQLVGIDPQFHNNDVRFYARIGMPVPDGRATVRVIVREGTDRYGLLSATAQIQRMVSDPVFPPPSSATEYWTC